MIVTGGGGGGGGGQRGGRGGGGGAEKCPLPFSSFAARAKDYAKGKKSFVLRSSQ